MLILCALLAVCYLLAGHFFLKGLAWLNQKDDLIYMAGDPWPLKVLLWVLAILVWPSFVLDLGETLVKRKNR